jgi:hypothetical protein
MTMKLKFLLMFAAGLIEQSLYTLYLLAVNKYLVEVSSILMFSYMVIYLWLVDKIAKDKQDSIKLILCYASACMMGNWIIMALKVIK